MGIEPATYSLKAELLATAARPVSFQIEKSQFDSQNNKDTKIVIGRYLVTILKSLTLSI